MTGDFERELTERVWADDAFAARLEESPAEALRSIGLSVPPGIKVKVVVQKRDRIYFTIPPVRPAGAPAPTAPLNQMDLWSSQGLFIWLVPVAAKFKLLALRNAAREQEKQA